MNETRFECKLGRCRRKWHGKRLWVCFWGIPLVLAALTCASRVLSAESPVAISIKWSKVTRVSRTTPTLQVVVNPLLRRNSPIHGQVFQDLKDLQCNDVRFVPWLPYPKLGVAELKPPQNGRTSWNFSLIDPIVEDFFHATSGHPSIVNFSVIPQWMFKTAKPVAYPENPDQITWRYQQGTELRDPSMKEVADYYRRLVSWYTRGGFHDEYGKWHRSNHHYKIAYWEVLNEVDDEHHMSPEFYTALYDAIVTAIHQVSPATKFVGMALGGPAKDPKYFEYFLNHKNHRPGVPLDMISYHFYAQRSPDQSAEMEPSVFFQKADHFLDVVRYIETIRRRLSPETRTAVDEIGTMSPVDFGQERPNYVFRPIPDSYWNLSGALFAYVFLGLSRQGIDIAAESALAQYPRQWASVTMVDWKTGRPNARYWVLKLLRDNFGPGDKLVDTQLRFRYVAAQGFATPSGRRKILLINKRDRPFEVSLPEAAGSEVTYVDQTTGFRPPASMKLSGNTVTLRGLEVAVVTLSK